MNGELDKKRKRVFLPSTLWVRPARTISHPFCNKGTLLPPLTDTQIYNSLVRRPWQDNEPLQGGENAKGRALYNPLWWRDAKRSVVYCCPALTQ